MGEWIPDFIKDLTWAQGLAGVGMALGGIAITNIAVCIAIVKLPADYFVKRQKSFAADKSPVVRWALLIGKNVLGACIVLLGILLSLPGIPGPGIIIILLGITMLNFPGKRALIRKIVGRPSVLKFMNWLRQRYDKPPIILQKEGENPDADDDDAE